MPEKTTSEASKSAVRDGTVDTSGAFRTSAARAGGLSRKEETDPDKVDAMFETGDPSDYLGGAPNPDDPAWKAFQHAESESLMSPRAETIEQEAARAGLPPEIAAMLQHGGDPTKAAAAAAATTTKPAEGSTAAQNTQPAAKTEEKATAFAALKRDGWPDAAIEKLDPAVLLEVGTARAKAQEAIDSKLNERRQQKAAKGSAGEGESSEAQDDASEDGATRAAVGPGQAAPPVADLARRAAADFTAELSEAFGEEIGKPLGEKLERGFVEVANAASSGNEALREGLSTLAGFLQELVVRDVRRNWETEYPDALAGETWTDIQKAHSTLVATGKYQGLEGYVQAYDHARNLVKPGLTPASAAKRRAAEDARIAEEAASQPIGSGASARQGVATEDAAAWDAFVRSERMSNMANQALLGGI